MGLPKTYSLRPWITFVCTLTLMLAVLGSFTWLAHAEGSRNLYPNGATGFRANLEWRTSTYGEGDFLIRRTLLRVYAEAGEVILVGSSAVGVDAGDILIYNPGTITGRVGDETLPATPDFNCEAQRGSSGTLAQGQITSRVQELAGPDTVPGGTVPNGYIPCFYEVSETGIYGVVFYGPDGGDSDNETTLTGELDLSSPNNFNAQQGTSVAAWDVTVRSSLDSASDINGRLFASYLSMLTGGSGQPLNSPLSVLTSDGYQYQINLRAWTPSALSCTLMMLVF